MKPAQEVKFTFKIYLVEVVIEAMVMDEIV